MGGSGWTRRFAAVVFAIAVAAPATHARAQAPSGSTLSPDFRSYMVNKDLGDERWSIDLNLYSTDPASIISITGNIFRKDGGPASFVACLIRDDSTGSLTNPSSTFRLSCSGADACATTARQCARESWTLIDDDVRVPASFFLPPGGNGASAAQDASVSDALLAKLRELLARTRASSLVRGVAALAGPARALAQGTAARGATLTIDSLSHLVTKDVGSERWAISYTLEPYVTEQGGVENRFLSLTGNVYQSDGAPPSFVFCTQRDDSTGSLSDPSSTLRFACQGADACENDATTCAQSSWRPISEDVALSASFFLPPLGLPAAPQSDPEIVIIGRTSDPPSILTPGNAGTAGLTAGSTSARYDTTTGACPVGDTCAIANVGRCASLTGEVVDDPAAGCRCLLREVPDSCIRCGDGATGQCGGPCTYAVGGATARGQCLPSSSQSEQCICWAIGAGRSDPTEGCGGVLGVVCPGDRCCANDPRNSCDPLGGQIACSGVCVDANGCDPEVERCGICLTPPDLPTPTPRRTAVPTPTPCLAQGSRCSVQGAPCCAGTVCQLSPLGDRSTCVPLLR
ncbi:hypothetical protein K2Z84_09935 [Candidatus Binatia bacterium]|nr:hypothetical protein [Candidatus Binatia bacterium]